MIAIRWSRKASKQLDNIQSSDKKQILSAVDSLSNFPYVGNIKALKNHKYDYRLRVGRYRVLFNNIEKIHIISIEEVRKRDDSTY